MSLYQKHRPTTFEEVFGNTQTIDALYKFTQKKERPHAYLFSGSYGTGKTTCARIFAKEIGCDSSVYELNMSETRGIDAVREMIDMSKFVPLGGAQTLWILDEAHGLTGEAANAILKLLEDPPSHAFFILCTTELGKINKGIQSRCTQFTFGPLNKTEMKMLLRSIEKKEEIEIDPDIQLELIEASDGYPRRALVLLESIASISGNENRHKYIEEVRNEIDIESPEMIEVIRQVVNGHSKSWKSVAGRLSIMQKNKADPEALRRGILTYMSKVLLSSTNIQAEKISDRMRELSEPTYNTGFAGLINQIYRALQME
jgi:DNA polymerase-3 subunit gamma/tau